jgi:hypothetical protein
LDLSKTKQKQTNEVKMKKLPTIAIFVWDGSVSVWRITLKSVFNFKFILYIFSNGSPPFREVARSLLIVATRWMPKMSRREIDADWPAHPLRHLFLLQQLKKRLPGIKKMPLQLCLSKIKAKETFVILQKARKRIVYNVLLYLRAFFSRK